MTGGINCPPVEATASIEAAILGGKPDFFIIGMVIIPVPATLATALPDIDPKRIDPIREILAAPPFDRPIVAVDRSEKNSDPPHNVSNFPISRNGTMTKTPISNALPNIALVSIPR